MPQPFSGFLELDTRGFGFIRSNEDEFDHQSTDVFVDSRLIQRYSLREGARIEGSAEPRKGKNPHVLSVNLVNGLVPEEWSKLVEFTRLTVVSPIQVTRHPYCSNKY